tara:strand:+ start:12 stop:620 length:609 start_codon:yes stop_codon:yes gene_type:complete
MKNYLILIITYSILFCINHPGHNSLNDWNVLNGDNQKIWIGWLDTPEIDWARTISTIPYSIDKVSKMIEDLENYYQIFDRVKSSDIIKNDIVHIRIDMPFPISDRDYIVQYKIDIQSDYKSYKFQAVKDTEIPINGDCIRLVNAAGEWYLKVVDESSTQVIYTWNGELGGDFPDWALTRAWGKQGTEMIEWLTESLEELYKE